MRKRAELLAHIQNTHHQYNLPEMGKKPAHKANRQGVARRFPDPSVRKGMDVALALTDIYDNAATGPRFWPLDWLFRLLA